MAEQIIDPSLAPRATDCWWGEVIYGTELQIQSFGIAQGMTFDTGKKCELKTVDPRGLPVTIQRFSGDTFSASIHYFGREKYPSSSSVPKQFAQDVAMVQSLYDDEYIGTAEALASAGLIDAHHLPGRPGMRKLHVTINPDGTVPQGAPTANNSQARMAGARRISRVSNTKFRLAIRVPDDEAERRWVSYQQKTDAFLRRMWALPRPAPLLSPSSSIGGRFAQYLSTPAPRRELPPMWRVIVNPNPPRV